MTSIALLAVLLGLQIKHLLFDFFFQTKWQLQNKGTYGHPGGIVHAGFHGIGTLVVFAGASAAVTASIFFVLVLALADFAIHYHVDWVKAQLSRDLGPSDDAPWFWVALGLDQAAHQLTYLGLAAAWLFVA
ncbi:MAG: DUF3307 domain-containing protein [Pseudomonadota bacterium]